jgi:hypothetical protein
MKRPIAFLFSFCFVLTLNAQVSKTVNISAGGLSAALNNTEKNTITNLTVTGTIDARDVLTMRDNMPALAVIDLGATTVEYYKGTLGTIIGQDVTYPANAFPKYAFSHSSTYAGKLTLTSIVLPATITSIESSAFQNCTGFTSFHIPYTVTFIDSWAFYNFGNPCPIVIPKNVSTLGNFAFEAINGPITVVFDNPTFKGVDGVLFNHAKTTLIQCPASKTGSYTIPSSVTTIGLNAFSHCSMLRQVRVPSSVLTIGEWAFRNCTGLTAALTIPASVSSIGNGAFYYCTSLDSIVALPNAPVDISSRVFVFDNVDKSTCKLFVREGSYSAYHGANQWSAFTNIIEFSGFMLSSTTASVEATANSTASVDIFTYVVWNASSNQAWLTVSPTYDNSSFYFSLNFTAAANPTNSPRNATVTVSASGFSSQTITITQEAAIPNDKSIANKTVYNSEIKCYNAFNTITVAGGGTTVEFQNGSTVDLIAGQAIFLMPGFHAFEGSLTHAYITTNGTYCYGASGSPVVDQPVEKSINEETLPEKPDIIAGEKSVKVYPNPNNGQFTIELKNFDGNSEVCIYNTLGKRIYQSVGIDNSRCEISLPEITQGIYLVRVNNGKEQFAKRIVVKR